MRAITAEQKRLGERLRGLRGKLPRELVAESAQLSDKVLGRVERGESNVTLGTLVALARFYRVRVADLFG